MMKQSEKQRIVLETLDNVNKSLKSNNNSLTSTRSGAVDPDRAYIDLVRELLAIYQEP